MILDISHRTHYRYTSPVVQSQHIVRMQPRAFIGQTVRHTSLIVEPAPSRRHEATDAQGNQVVMLDLERPHEELVLLARSRVERGRPPAVELEATTAWDEPDAPGNVPLDLDVARYRCHSRLTTPTREIARFARQFFPARRPVLAGTRALVDHIYASFKFDPTATDLSTPVTTVLETRSGVCQDFAHLALATLRALHIPARYVSGYILTRPPPGQPKLQGADASHAWIAVHAPETGWVEFDPTNGILVSDEHIVVAYGRDYEDISPINGVLLGGGDHSLSVAVDVNVVE